jgi:hypothetical protein
VFGSRKRIQELEATVAALRSGIEQQNNVQAENAQLQQLLDQLQGREAWQVAKAVAAAREKLAATNSRIAAAQAEAEAARRRVAAAEAEVAAARAKIVETDEIALLQEVGIYQYRHPLDDAVAYQSRLKQIRDSIKTLAKDGRAVTASHAGWTVNGSVREGEKMTRDLSKLMLRAYNAEADNVVRTLRPHGLASAVSRLDKTRDTIAKLGTIIQLQVSQEYHRARLYELELTADRLVKVEEEKERLREERARQREDEKAQRELEAERRRLEKEQIHYQTALEKLRAGEGSPDAVTEMEERLALIESAIVGIENREANIRAGYVYVISNFGSFGDRVVKIGLTRRLDPMELVRELGDASVPFNFDVHALVFSDDAVGLENGLHHHFKDRRVNLVNMRREYFYITPAEVRVALEQLGRQQLLEFHEVPEAAEWRASGGAKRTAALADGIV